MNSSLIEAHRLCLQDLCVDGKRKVLVLWGIYSGKLEIAFCSWHDPMEDAPRGRWKLGSEGQVMTSLYCTVMSHLIVMI